MIKEGRGGETAGFVLVEKNNRTSVKKAQRHNPEPKRAFNCVHLFIYFLPYSSANGFFHLVFPTRSEINNIANTCQ